MDEIFYDRKNKVSTLLYYIYIYSLYLLEIENVSTVIIDLQSNKNLKRNCNEVCLENITLTVVVERL